QSGSTAQTLTLTGTTTNAYFGSKTTFNGNLTVSSPSIEFGGATFNGATNSFTKTGTGNIYSVGGNTFAAGTSTTFTFNTTGFWRFAGTTADTYTGNVEFANTSTGTIQVAYAGTNDFGGNLTLTPGSGDITVGAGTGTAQFSKASGTQTLTSGGKTFPILTHTGAGTLQLSATLTATTLTNSAGTLDLNSNNITVTTFSNADGATLQLNGNETTVSLTNDTDSGLTKFVKSTGTITIKSLSPYYNIEFDSNASGDGDAVFTLPANTVVNGNLTIADGTLDTSVTNFNLNIAGNWTNSSNEATTFNPRAAAVILDGTSQAISGTTTFNNFTKQVAAADTLTFTAASTQTINGALTLNGAAGQLLSLRSSSDGTYWNIVNTGDTEAVSYVDVKDSNNTGSTISATDSTNSDHNVGWSFAGAALTVSGTGLDADGAALTGSSYNVALRVDGAALQTTTTSAIDGTFSFSVEGLAAGNVITIYFYGATDPEAGTYVGNAVTLTDASTNITGVNLQANNVLLRADNGANSLTIADMAFYDSSDNLNNLIFTAIAAIPDTLTIGDGVKVTVNSGDTFTPGGDSTIGTGTLTIAGTWIATGTESLSLGGALTATAGTFTAASDTVTFTGGTTTTNVNVSMTFNNLTLNKDNGAVLTITSGDTLAVGGTLTLTDGYVNTGTLALNTANLTGSSTFDGGSAPILLDDSQTVTLSDGWVLPSLNVDTATVTIANSASITFANAGLTVGATGTLNQGTGTTVSFTGSGDRTIDVNTSDTLVNLTINKAADGNIITIATGDTLVLTGTLTLTNGQVNTGTLQAQGDVSLASTFDGGDGILQFTGAATQTLTDGGGVLPSGTVTVNKTVGTAVNLAAAFTLDTAGQDLTITSGTLNLAGFGLTLTAAADVLTVSAGGTLRLQGGETITASTKTLDAGSTVEYNGSGGPYTLQTLSYSNLTIAGGPAVVFSLPANTTGLTTLTITSGILAAAGFNLTATTLVNDATLRLQGNETTVTFTTMDTGSGTVEYVGRNVAETLTVKDFGATDYYDLTINDANTNKATFQLGAAKVLGRNLALTSGTLDLASFGLTVPTDFTIGASGTLKLQGGETVSAIDTNSGTVNYNGTGSYTTALSAGNAYTNLIFSGSGVWEPSGAVAVSGALTVSSGTFDLDGQNLVVTGALTNDSTLRLSGAETTVTFGTMDANSGTVTYDGNNTTNTYNIKDFGDTDYYNLSFTDANASKIVLRVADASPLTVAGALTLSSGSGTFDNATYDEAITVTGDVTMDNTRTDMGDATWTVSGSFDNKDVTTWNYNASTLVMNGTGKEIISGSDAKKVRNFTVSAGATITIPAVSSTVYSAGSVQINGTLTVPSGEGFSLYQGTPKLAVSATGSITGAGTISLNESVQITQKDGIIDVATMNIYNNTANGYIIPATYEAANINIIKNWALSESFKFGSGNYTFNGNLTFNNANATETLTISNSTNNPNITVLGNVTISESSGSIAWTKGAGTITFAKSSGTQTVNFLDKSVEDLIIGDGATTNTVQLTDGVTTDGITVNSGSTLDMNSQAISYAAATGSTNNGTIKLKGDETLTNISNLDTDSGWVEYTGTGAYATLPYTGIYYNLNFSGSGSYTLPATLDANSEFALNGSAITAPSTELTVGGNFTKTSGTFAHNSGLVTLDGTSQVISGSTTFNDLTAQTAGQTLTFTTGTTQTVGGVLTLAGASGNLVTLESSSGGNAWNLVNNGASSTAQYLSVSDSNLTGTGILAYNSTNGGGNSASWVFPNSYTVALTNGSQSASSLVPGTSYGFTVTLYDSNGNVATGLNGDANLTFTGNSSSGGYVPTATDKNSVAQQFGDSTTLTFTAGVATTNVVLYKAEQGSFSLTDGSVSGSFSFTTLTPSGTVSAADAATGNASYTSGASTLTLTPTRAAKVKVSNADSFSGASYENLTSLTAAGSAYTKSWTVTDGDGAKTVYAKYQDAYGNESATASGVITRDNTGPAVAGAYGYDVANPTRGTYATLVSFQPATDAGSGVSGADTIVSYAVKRNNESVTVDGVTGYASEKSGTKVFYVLDSGLQPIVDYVYTISIKDALGNTGETKATVAPTANNLKAGKDVKSTTIRLSSSSNAESLLKELGKLELSKAEAKSEASSANKEEVTATVSWLSSIPSTSQVYYGPGKDLGFQTLEDTGLNTSHQAVLTDLKPNTNYTYKVVSKDANGNTAEIGGQSFTTKAAEGKDSILKVITKKLTAILTDIWQAIKTFFTFGRAQAATPSGGVIYVIDISTQAAPAHFISWPKGMGSVSLQQCSPGCFTIATTGANFFVATNVKAGTGYSYKVGSLATNIDTAPTKTPEITKVNAKPLTSGAIITWRTDNEPSTSLVSYGVSQATDQQSPSDPYFNQSHTVYLKNLKPSTTYYYKVASANRNNTAVTSQLQSFTTAGAEKQTSILEQIIQALTRAFRVFEGWINK
ncbi:MAG TPA: fibronectin type III domain-containing protein, partial [Patescibacteria group bacterium]|nr:fibronectin type III domain-containing protein [Patescibacteria group bacterium]